MYHSLNAGDFRCFYLTYLTNAKIKHYVGLMQQKYILYWQQAMQSSTKLEFFNTFKNDYIPSSYLGIKSKPSERKELVKFKIGDHKLRIETGRYDQIPRVNRLCPICDHLALIYAIFYFQIKPMKPDCYIITLFYDHDNRYCFSFSFGLQKLLQDCMYLWSCK